MEPFLIELEFLINDNFELKEFLFEFKTLNIDYKKKYSKYGLTPLMILICYKDKISDKFIEKVKWLLSFKNTVNDIDYDNWTALHYACSYIYEDYEEIMKLLLERGADVNAATKKGLITPLMSSISWEFQSFKDIKKKVQILIEYGANRSLKNSRNDTARLMFIYSLYPKVILTCCHKTRIGFQREPREDEAIINQIYKLLK